MKSIRLAVAALALLLAAPIAAFAQSAPVGQTAGGAINQTAFNNNSNSVGFNQMSFASIAVPSSSTTQATFGAGGVVLTGTVVPTKTLLITACSGSTGVTLPALQRYEAITIMNRSGGILPRVPVDRGNRRDRARDGWIGERFVYPIDEHGRCLSSRVGDALASVSRRTGSAGSPMSLFSTSNEAAKSDMVRADRMLIRPSAPRPSAGTSPGRLRCAPIPRPRWASRRIHR